MPSLRVQPIDLSILRPTKSTLARYGLSIFDWGEMLRRQGGVCAVCKRVPPSKRFVIDHEHVKGWRRMKPKERGKFVRGVLCSSCNAWYLARGLNVERALAVVEYLTAYHKGLSEERE